MNDRVKELEREIEMLQKVVELMKQIEEMNTRQQIIYVPYVPYENYPWWKYQIATAAWTTNDTKDRVFPVWY